MSTRLPFITTSTPTRFPSQSSSGSATGTIDWITLTSPAITARLHALLATGSSAVASGSEIRLASLSPVTTEAARSVGWTVAVEAAEFTWEGLVQAIVDRWSENASREPGGFPQNDRSRAARKHEPRDLLREFAASEARASSRPPARAGSPTRG